MKTNFLFFILLNYAESCDDIMIEVVKAISEIHYFSCYVTLNSDLGKSFFEKLTKSIYSNSKFSTVVQIPMEQYKESLFRFKKKGSRCLKIADGCKSKINRKKFAELSEEINIADNDIWLLFLDEVFDYEKYLNSLILPFDIQLIAALKANETFAHLKAPYRVAKDFPLRITEVGFWSRREGLNLSTTEVASARKNMEGFRFRTGTIHSPPIIYLSYDANGNLNAGGYFAEIWKELSERLNFTYEFIPSVDGTFGILNPNGTYTTGLFGMVTRNHVDAIVVDIIINKERLRYVDFSVPIISFGNQIYFTHIGNHLEWGNWLKPFSREVWLALLGWFAAVSASLGILYSTGCYFNFENVAYKKDFVFFGAFFILIRAITSQGNDRIPESLSSRGVFYTAYLTTAIVLPFYSAALISHLTIQIPVRPFRSLEGMLEVGTHKLSVMRKSSHYTYFSNATEPLLMDVYERLLKPLKESELPYETRGGLELVCRKKGIAFYGADVKAKAFLDDFLIELGCRLMTLETPLSHNDFTIVFQKGSPYTLMINVELRKMKCEGLLDRLENRIWFKKKEIMKHDIETIEIDHVAQIHCILLGGCFISIFIFIFEKYCSSSIRRMDYSLRIDYTL